MELQATTALGNGALTLHLGRVFHVVFTMRGIAIRTISARKANKRDVNDYENAAFQT
jgi:uncharacterized DUF497 family protein